MSLLKRLTMSAALVAAAAAAATSAVVPHPSVEQWKRDILRDALSRMDHASPDWVVLQAGIRASALSALRLSATPQQTVLSLTLDGDVLALVDRPNRDRIVLDSHQAIPVLDGAAMPARDGLVRAIHVQLHAVEPQFVTRISLDTSTRSTVSFKRTANGLDVILTSNDGRPSPQDAVTETLDALLAHEQAQLDVRRSAFDEMSMRLVTLHAEHARFLRQALTDLDQVLHECKLAHVQDRLESVVPAQDTASTVNWADEVATLEAFLRDATQQQHDLDAGLQTYRDATATAMDDLAGKTEAACEQHAAASVTAAALGTLESLVGEITPVVTAHEAEFSAIVAHYTDFIATMNSTYASLRDHALAHQQEGHSLLRSTPRPTPRSATAASSQSTTPADAIEAILHLKPPIEAVGDTSLDLSHAPVPVATLDSVPTLPESTPPGKRNATAVTTDDAQPVATDNQINSRMQTIFPGIGEPDAEMQKPAAPMLAAVNDTAAESMDPMAPSYSGDPLDQLVNIDFREMELSHVVSILAKKAQINVIAGTDITGTVTANLRNVPLRQAMETALRMNGLGMLEEDGIFRIVSYEEAVAARRATRMLYLNNAQADEVKKTLDDVLVGSPDAALMSISANPSTNVVILSGPAAAVSRWFATSMSPNQPCRPLRGRSG